MAENRFLQSFCAVAASSVLVCGTLLLLTSTAPWTPPDIVSEPSTPDAPTVFAATESTLDTGKDAVAPEAPERQAALHVEDAARNYTASIQRLPDAEERDEPATGHERIVALDSPLSAETAGADSIPDVAAQDATLPEPVAPVAPETIAAAADQIADLLSTLPPRVLAGDQSAAATKEVAEELAALPPPPSPVNAAEKTAPARDEVATMLAALPPPPMVTVAAELAQAAKPESLQGGVKIARLNTNALMLASFAPQTAEAKTAVEFPEAPEPVSVTASAATPPSLPQPVETAVAVEMLAAQALAADEQPAPKLAALSAESVTNAAPPPPLPRRKPAEIVAAKADDAAAPAEAEPQAKTPVASATAQDKQTVQAPKQQVAQGGGLFGLFKPGTFTKPMTLAPADQPVAAPKVSVARPRSGAYASQVWSRLARAKPRAGARGSASVSFAIAANGSLGAVRIARSSGNSRIDQLALQTVRNAAPFPAPPSGAAAYTIRIDF